MKEVRAPSTGTLHSAGTTTAKTRSWPRWLGSSVPQQQSAPCFTWPPPAGPSSTIMRFTVRAPSNSLPSTHRPFNRSAGCGRASLCDKCHRVEQGRGAALGPPEAWVLIPASPAQDPRATLTCSRATCKPRRMRVLPPPHPPGRCAQPHGLSPEAGLSRLQGQGRWAGPGGPMPALLPLLLHLCSRRCQQP